MTGVPQSWQNFDPGVSATPHARQLASRTTAPHCVQKRPAAGAAHAGQGMGASDWVAPTFLEEVIHGVEKEAPTV
jgi:hypothetical protein